MSFASLRVTIRAKASSVNASAAARVGYCACNANGFAPAIRLRLAAVRSPDNGGIVIFRKCHPKAIAWLRRFSVADIVRQNDEIFACVEHLAWAEKFTRKLWLKELMPRAAGAMEDHHGIGDVIPNCAEADSDLGFPIG